MPRSVPSTTDGMTRALPGVAHNGTTAFGNRVLRGRLRKKAARRAKRNNRRSK